MTDQSHTPLCSEINQKVSKRILIMMSNTGGGHKASAEAIKAAFLEKYRDDYEVSNLEMGNWTMGIHGCAELYS
jgi:predicted Ser/Thr protein kinase